MPLGRAAKLPQVSLGPIGTIDEWPDVRSLDNYRVVAPAYSCLTWSKKQERTTRQKDAVWSHYELLPTSLSLVQFRCGRSVPGSCKRLRETIDLPCVARSSHRRRCSGRP